MFVRQKLHDGTEGPIIGKGDDIDTIAYAGEYASEIIHATPLIPRPESKLCVPQNIKQQLADDAVAVWENAIDDTDIYLQQIKEKIQLQPNGQDSDIRTDFIRFVDTKDDSTLAKGFNLLEHIATQLTLPGFTTLLAPAQAMVSMYPSTGGHYTQHLDNERDGYGHWRNYRALTIILYLNKEQQQGGQLVLFNNKQQQLTVTPNAGTVVMFDSTKIKHRVAPSKRDRYAMTRWFVSPNLLQDEKPPRGYKLEPPRKRSKQQQQQQQVWVKPIDISSNSSFSFF
mmetsp:Transcript_7884/g.12740  ORF Transcript_7884/g.12740 Transcript_7884/m.12740 type:complete len:283 (+) Transcript_7884:1083-1931(+)